MDLYNFIHGLLAWTASITALWPINIPLMALAYKIRRGTDPIDLPKYEFWMRSTFATLGIALTTFVALGLDYYLAASLEYPPGPIHLVILMAFTPAAIYIIFVFFALEDPFHAVSQFVIYVFLPIMVLFLLNAIFGLWEPLLDLARSWLPAPEVAP